MRFIKQRTKHEELLGRHQYTQFAKLNKEVSFVLVFIAPKALKNKQNEYTAEQLKQALKRLSDDWWTLWNPEDAMALISVQVTGAEDALNKRSDLVKQTGRLIGGNYIVTYHQEPIE